MNTKKYTWLFVGLFTLFLVMRLPGLHIPYHQDEWKNVAASATDDTGSYWAHPPLMQMSFRTAYIVFGQDNYRLFPLVVSLATGILLFAVVRRRSGQGAALWSLFLFIICFYNILGSLMPDVDGAIIPFFFLASVYAYDMYLSSSEMVRRRWFVWLFIICLVGFLVKLNFILAIGAIIADYLLTNWRALRGRPAFPFVASLGIFGVAYVALLYLFQAIYPGFTIASMLGHANQFSGETGRNYTQIIVQGLKAVYYLSPLLLAPLLFVKKEIFVKLRVFFIYLLFGLLFYFVLFDFSRGALDKYLMFLIVPLAAIGGTVLSGILSKLEQKDIWSSFKLPIVMGVIVSVALVWINFIPHDVIALYPKSEWFARALHGQWKMLTPLTGGSGPLGFYVSFLFIILSNITVFVLAVVAFFKKEWRPAILVVVLFVGISYNLVFAEEYTLGMINGSAPTVLEQTIDFIVKEDSIKQVLTYNDIGAGNLSAIKKYGGRFYAAPQYEEGHKDKFNNFDGVYMVIDVPHLYEQGFYGKFFSQCKVLFEASSYSITGRVYKCL